MSNIAHAQENTSLSEEEKETSEFMLMFQHLLLTKADLHISQSGRADVYGFVEGSSTVDKSRIVATLQRYEYGRWEIVKSFIVDNDDYYVELMGQYYVTKGYDYKLVCKAYVYDHTGKCLDSSTYETKSYTY